MNEYIWIKYPLRSSYFDGVMFQLLNLDYTCMLFPTPVKLSDGCGWIILGVIFIIPHPVHVLFLVYILQLV